MIAPTPAPPYYAVVFTAVRSENDQDYAATAARMVELAFQQPGFLGIEHAEGDVGITVSYWRDPQAMLAWKRNAEHQEAQRRGRTDWYRNLKVRIAHVERDYALGDSV